MKCEYCNKEQNENYGSGRFCNVICARGYATKDKRLDINKKVRLKILGRKHTSLTKEKISKNNGMKRKEISQKVAKKIKHFYVKHPERRKTAFRFEGNKFHRKSEKKAKLFIERYFNTENLVSKKINKRWFDFVNDKYIIEYTINNLGITNAIRRFSDIINDKREKYLLAIDKNFGKYRKNQLVDLNVKFIDVKEILPT